MSDVAEFVRARLDEDEAAAKAATLAEGSVYCSELADVEYISRHDPARGLRDVTAMRQIVDLHTDDEYRQCIECRQGMPCDTSCALASIWSDHPSFQAEWSEAR